MDLMARLGLADGQDEWARLFDGPEPPEPRLPPRSSAPALLDRLGVAAEDAAEILAGWPSPGWPDELRRLLARVVARVGADLGGGAWLVPGPWIPRDRGPAWRHFYVYAYLALLGDALAYHARHGIPEYVSWTTLADLGRNLAIDRRMNGEGWPVMLSWITLHVRGSIYELGRLQFHQREATGLSLHIPRSGPLTPEACDASFARAREFFPRHFPGEDRRLVTCGSWLLDPVLADLLPPESNIVRFQRRFEVDPGTKDATGDMLYFVFGTATTPPDRLRARTALQRAVLAHLRAGGGWRNSTGRLML